MLTVSLHVENIDLRIHCAGNNIQLWASENCVFCRYYCDLCNRKYEGECDTMRFVLCSSVLVLWETM